MRITARIGLAVMMVVGIGLVAPAAASATPVGCGYGVNYVDDYATSHCSSGTGQHRAYVVCKRSPWAVKLFGEWRNAGQESRAYCYYGYEATGGGYEVRG